MKYLSTLALFMLANTMSSEQGLYQYHWNVIPTVKVTSTPLVAIHRASVYNAVAEQTNSNPLTTADGSKINPEDPKGHRWIAVSRDLMRESCVAFGDTVRVIMLDTVGNEMEFEYSGRFVVRDLMNARYERSIDFLTTDRTGLWEGNIYLEL